MTYTSLVPVGTVLVIERRRCLGRRYDEAGQLVDCGAVYDSPARKLARVFLTPRDRSAYSISTVRDKDSYDYSEVQDQWIDGKHRTVYIQETTCEQCQTCFKETIGWQRIHELKPPHVVEPLTTHTEEEYQAAVSKRDQLGNQVDAARKLLLACREQHDRLQDEYELAVENVRLFARVHQYNKAARQYGWEQTTMRKLKEDEKRRSKPAVVPLPDDEI